jgi:diguanylate cyclase (GGDEF)-like protein/PAS domain S-box-containing protein
MTVEPRSSTSGDAPRSRAGWRGDRRWRVWCAVLAAATAAFTVAVGTGAGGPRFSADLSDVATAAIAAAAAAGCLWRSRRHRGRRRWAWALIGLGTAFWALGGAACTWYETVQRVPGPFPGPSDLGYLGMVPLAAVGVLLIPTADRSAAHRARSLVDGVLTAASLLLVSWVFVIGPLTRLGPDSPLALGVLVGHPVGDVVLATVALFMVLLMRGNGDDPVPLALMAAGLLLFASTDTAWAYRSLDGPHASGGPLDAGWFAGLALMTLAAVREPDPPSAARTPEWRWSPATLLPYAAVLAAFGVTTLWSAGVHLNVTVVSYGRSTLILLIVGRQLLTVLENRQLTRYLESRVAERAADLTAREQRFRALVRHSSESLAVIDADSTVRYQSDSIEPIFGYSVDQITGRRLSELLGHRSGALLDAAIESIIGRPYGTAVFAVLMPHRDGRWLDAEMTITNLLDDAHVHGLVLNTRDVSEAKELQDRLVHEAYHDGLTGLPSRVLFTERLSRALADAAGHADGGPPDEASQVAVLLLDLDGFKGVNDSLGHATGDHLLRHFAEQLRAAVRDDDLVARFGGDEFAVLIESAATVREAELVAARIVELLHQPLQVDGRDIHIGASVGLAYATDAGDVDQLMRNADLAMYQAKSAGGSRFSSYEPRMLATLVDRLRLETDLRLALDRNELCLHYQPTVDLADNRIVGFEALVRWQHPTLGMISPLDFIGVAEASGLIVPLGAWVITEACRQVVAWAPEVAWPLKMAVNVSVRQFERTDVAAVVAGILAETGMPAGQLCLEMTESVLLSDTDENLAQLHRLKALGLTLAMDDFGTGYSSLAYLSRFPMDVLKVDRSFVQRLDGDHEDVALVETIVRLAQRLGMTTVAEGIEEPSQLVELRRIGCELGQGYYLSRPQPAAEAGRLLREGLDIPASTAAPALP